MAATTGPGLKRSLSVWQAVGLSMALMAPSMAANINPEGAAGARHRPARMMPSVPAWQVVIPIAAIVLLGYTLYRNVYPYPSGDGRWFPVVAGAWLLVAVIAVIVAPRMAARLGEALTAQEGITAEHGLLAGEGLGTGDGVSAAEA
jgi:hypothetical protein